MNRTCRHIFLLLCLFCFSHVCFSANVVWDKAFVVYEGLDSSGVYEQYTMGSPYLFMTGFRNGNSLELRAQPEANLVAANTFVLLVHASMDYVISPEFIYNSPAYFAYAAYTDTEGGCEEMSDYSVVITQGESVYLGFASQPATMTDPITCGWIELGLDGEGTLSVLRSAWDMDGDPIRVGATPEPSSALLLLVGGALLALRRKDNRAFVLGRIRRAQPGDVLV